MNSRNRLLLWLVDSLTLCFLLVPIVIRSCPFQEDKPVVKKNKSAPPLGVIVKVKPQAKKAKIDPQSSQKSPVGDKKPDDSGEKPVAPVDAQTDGAIDPGGVTTLGLVSYSDDSEDDA